jgi:hypothetical protein
MGNKKAKANCRRTVLPLPDLDHSKTAVLNSLTSPGSRRVYKFAIEQFITWYCCEPRLAFNRIVVVRYRMYLEGRGLAANTIKTTSSTPANRVRSSDQQSLRKKHHRGPRSLEIACIVAAAIPTRGWLG